MTVPRTIAHASSRSPELWLGLALVVVGLLGHVFAARAIGGSYVAFRDHLAGFVIILVVTGGLIAVAGRRFWPGRSDRTWLVIGIVQALLGVYVYHIGGH